MYQVEEINWRCTVEILFMTGPVKLNISYLYMLDTWSWPHRCNFPRSLFLKCLSTNVRTRQSRAIYCIYIFVLRKQGY